MFGRNPIRKDATHLDGRFLAVQSIFYTLQGEGPLSGRPAVFARLAGCNLACHFCDTEFESGIDNVLSVETIAEQVERFRHHDLVVLTGGEPLRQNILPLVLRLMGVGVKLVQIETAGTLWVPGLGDLVWKPDDGRLQPSGVVLVTSPKTPKIHPEVVRHTAHYKYVIEHDKVDPKDGLPGWGMQTRNLNQAHPVFRPWDDENVAYAMALDPGVVTVWVSPCDAHNEEATRLNTEAAVRSALDYGHRLSLQTHKIVNLP